MNGLEKNIYEALYLCVLLSSFPYLPIAYELIQSKERGVAQQTLGGQSVVSRLSK